MKRYSGVLLWRYFGELDYLRVSPSPMSFEVLTVVNVKVIVLWDVTTCTLVGGH